MRWITTDNVISWGMRVDSIAELPTLIHRLIRSSSPKTSFINFPDGRQIFNAGIDGFVKSPEGTEYVPEGISVWELGTKKDDKSKADDDYKKRTAKPNGYVPAESTFIFVTPHSWAGKSDWVKEKELEKKWKEIKAYDCADLSAWFAIAEVVARDYAPIISYYPTDGIQTANDFWFEWSNRQNGITLRPAIITGGREYQIEQIRNFLNGNPNIKAVKASSKNEAIAFIIASAMQFEEAEQQNFFSRSLIIDTENNFRNISSKKQALVLISHIESNIIHRGPLEGNHVFLPLGADDNYTGDIITLPQINKEGMTSALSAIGFSQEEARKFIRESGHNITILKRLLKFPLVKSEWAKPENAQALIPALLIGRWDENKQGDKDALAVIAGEDYESYIRKLTKWKLNEIPFIYQIGTTWRLASPLDAWSNLSSFVTTNDLVKLENCFLNVLNSIRPAFDLEPEKRHMASFYGKESSYSEWVREGLIQSLILVGIYGEGLQLPTKTTPQLWVDSIIYKLLNNAESKLWASLNYVMPLIAEASPDAFLNAVENSLSKVQPEIMGMFEEEPSILSPHSYHTGLLWALEELAWMPEYLTKVTLILGQLSELDPGGKLSNRPLNSLRSIFLPWMPQTLSNFEQRHHALLLLIKKEPNIAWKLLTSILPKHHDVAHPTHKTRWRFFTQSTEKEIYREELLNTHTMIVNELLSLTEFNEDKIAQLVETTDILKPDDRSKVLDYITKNINNIFQTEYSIWHQIRKILHHHRSHPDVDWSLPDIELKKYQYLFEKLYPTDIVEKYKWLFDDHWPQFPEGENYSMDHDTQQKIINEKRQNGLLEIWKEFGIDKIIELSSQIKEKWAYGEAVAYIITEEKDILQFISEKKLIDKNEQYTQRGFVYRKDLLNGWNWSKNVFEKLKQKKYSNEALASFLIPLPQNQTLWNFISITNLEIESKYWETLTPFLYNQSLSEKVFAIEKLLSVERGLTAINESHRFVSDLESDFIENILRKGVISKEQIRFPDYQLEKIFENLYQRENFDRNKLAELEWMYLPILTRRFGQKNSLILYEELATNPAFFVEVLKWVYKPKNTEIVLEDLNELDKDLKRRRAEQAYNLLSTWDKVPGTDENNNINPEILNSWVKKVRELAQAEDRLDVADIEIGKILANYPRIKEQQWPPEPISELIDTINSDVLTRNFRTAIFNNRGATTKSFYEGGNQERVLAKYFKDISDRLIFKFPVTASVFKSLANGYEADAKEEDERAERDSLEY